MTERLCLEPSSELSTQLVEGQARFASLGPYTSKKARHSRPEKDRHADKTNAWQSSKPLPARGLSTRQHATGQASTIGTARSQIRRDRRETLHARQHMEPEVRVEQGKALKAIVAMPPAMRQQHTFTQPPITPHSTASSELISLAVQQDLNLLDIHHPALINSPIPLRAPAAMRRTPQGGPQIRIHGPPSSDGRPTNSFLRPAPRHPVPRAQSDQGWPHWRELVIKVRGLPSSITTLELWRIFSKEGRIDFIEIFEDRQGIRDGGAKIRYCPPPKAPFWRRGRYSTPSSDDGRGMTLQVSLAENNRDPFSPSPVKPSIRYPDCVLLLASSIQFGIMYNAETMMAMQKTVAEQRGQIRFELNLARRLLDVQLDLPVVDPRDPAQKAPRRLIEASDDDAIGSLNRVEKYRFRIRLEQLQEIKETQSDDGSFTMVVALDTPPVFYRKAVGLQLKASHDEDGTTWSEWDTWFRTTDIVYNPFQLRDVAISLKKPKPLIDIGRWTTYRFVFQKDEDNISNYRIVCSALRDHNIPVEVMDDFRFTEHSQPAVWQWIDISASESTVPTSSLAALQEETVPLLSFLVRYQLEVCISQGCLHEHNLSKAFVRALAELPERRALDVLEHVAQQQIRFYDAMAIFELNVKASTSTLKIPHYCAYARKATVTPTMVYYSSPQVDISNRVIRQYVEHADRFLRVQFTDEKFQASTPQKPAGRLLIAIQGRIHSSEKSTNNEVLTRVHRAMNNGITIGDRHFEFLAFGNSQFRENGAYFFAPTPFLNAADIRRWMGNFSGIRSPAKYCARLGQCFSTTRAINGARVEIKELRDVKVKHVSRSGTAEYIFTDGVGKISEFLAKIVAGELHLPFVPSVLQFRLGGCKGILTVWPDARDREIHIRPSQYKFPAIHNGLEINRWSQFSAATLNRQIILILTALGVEDTVFTRKQDEMLVELERATHDESMAVRLLQKYVDPNQMSPTLAGMILDGFMESEDPFVMSLVQLWRAWSIKYLKEKARIIVDEGAYLLGCSDETRTLQGHHYKLQPRPGSTPEQRLNALPEIFLQVPVRDAPGTYTIIEGICLLARNPSLHPGDVRVVRAVDRPGLRHLRDVVVLPQRGDRDIASMCSGGDLDGDDYIIIWDKDIIPKEWNHAPMDYSAPAPKVLDRDVTRRDMVNFFVNYMKNDRLGAIAVAHMAHADQSSAKDEKCLRLAALHSTAVDYVKSGVAAYMPKDLWPKRWPHFMESKYRPKEKIYRSTNVLGKLYDQVERVDFVPKYDAFDKRVLDAYQLGDEMLEQAREIKVLYDTDMRRTMAQYDIQTEFEVWSTFALHYADAVKDYKFHEELGQIAYSLKDRYREVCIAKAGGKDFDKLGPFVAAMYTVTQQEIAFAVAETRQMRIIDGREVPVRQKGAKYMPFMSFPWCFHDVLGKIAIDQYKSSSVRSEQPSRTWPEQRRQSNPTKEMQENPVLMEEDVVETAEGHMHRGDVLELFHQGHGTSEAGSDVDARRFSSAASSSRGTSRQRDTWMTGGGDVRETSSGYQSEAEGQDLPSARQPRSKAQSETGSSENLMDFGSTVDKSEIRNTSAGQALVSSLLDEDQPRLEDGEVMQIDGAVKGQLLSPSGGTSPRANKQRRKVSQDNEKGPLGQISNKDLATLEHGSSARQQYTERYSMVGSESNGSDEGLPAEQVTLDLPEESALEKLARLMRDD